MRQGSDWEEEFNGKLCPSLFWPEKKACKSYALYCKVDYCFKIVKNFWPFFFPMYLPCIKEHFIVNSVLRREFQHFLFTANILNGQEIF